MMIRRIIYGCLCAGCCCTVAAQERNVIREMWSQVEQNNLELQSAGYGVQAQQRSLAAENNLPDPEVEYTYLFGSPAYVGNETELIVTQGFDFPTLYARRTRYRKMQEKVIGCGLEEVRQNLKQQTADLCLDLIGLNHKDSLLRRYTDNLRAVLRYSEQQLAEGNGTIVERNKVQMELMEAETALRQNDAGHREILQELVALNGGKEIPDVGRDYPVLPAVTDSADEWIGDYRQHDASLLRMQADRQAGQQQIRVQQAAALPGLQLGYRRTTAQGEDMNGFVAGVSLPLFSNRNKVKAVKAEQLCRELQLSSRQAQDEAAIHALSNRREQLARALEGYDSRLLDEQAGLLSKSLELGQITVIEYLTEMNRLLDVQMNQVELENSYQKACYKLMRYRW